MIWLPPPQPAMISPAPLNRLISDTILSVAPPAAPSPAVHATLRKPGWVLIVAARRGPNGMHWSRTDSWARLWTPPGVVDGHDAVAIAPDARDQASLPPGWIDEAIQAVPGEMPDAVSRVLQRYGAAYCLVLGLDSRQDGGPGSVEITLFSRDDVLGTQSLDQTTPDLRAQILAVAGTLLHAAPPPESPVIAEAPAPSSEAPDFTPAPGYQYGVPPSASGEEPWPPPSWQGPGTISQPRY